MNELTPLDITETLHDELRSMIVQCRNRVTTVVNAELTQLYWAVGRRLGEEVLGGQRAQYGAKIVATLGEKLVGEFGRGFESKNLRRMIQFAETFPDIKIVVTLSRQLSWSHVVAILPIKNHEAREYYALKAAANKSNSWRCTKTVLSLPSIGPNCHPRRNWNVIYTR